MLPSLKARASTWFMESRQKSTSSRVYTSTSVSTSKPASAFPILTASVCRLLLSVNGSDSITIRSISESSVGVPRACEPNRMIMYGSTSFTIACTIFCKWSWHNSSNTVFMLSLGLPQGGENTILRLAEGTPPLRFFDTNASKFHSGGVSRNKVGKYTKSNVECQVRFFTSLSRWAIFGGVWR